MEPAIELVWIRQDVAMGESSSSQSQAGWTCFYCGRRGPEGGLLDSEWLTVNVYRGLDVEDLDMTFCSEAHMRARMADPLPAAESYPAATEPLRSHFPYWLVALSVAILLYSALAAIGAVAIHHWYVDR